LAVIVTASPGFTSVLSRVAVAKRTKVALPTVSPAAFFRRTVIDVPISSVVGVGCTVAFVPAGIVPPAVAVKGTVVKMVGVVEIV
jgi:hypothetical protein